MKTNSLPPIDYTYVNRDEPDVPDIQGIPDKRSLPELDFSYATPADPTDLLYNPHHDALDSIKLAFETGQFTLGAFGQMAGYISVPFDKAGQVAATVADPLVKLGTATVGSLLDKATVAGYRASGLMPENYEALTDEEHLLPRLGEALGNIKSEGVEPYINAGKTLIGKTPEGAKRFSDVAGSYHKQITRKEASELYKQGTGLAAEFLVSPWVVSKALKGVGSAAKLTGIPQKIAAAHPERWKDMKLTARMGKAAGQENAFQRGQTVSNEQLNSIARTLSKKTGKKVSPNAVGERVRQVIKGGITEQADIAKVANPIIDDFARHKMELQRLGVMSERVYSSQLTNAQRFLLETKKNKLATQIAKVESRSQFPGKTSYLNKLKTQHDKYAHSIKQSDHLGGEMYFPRMYEGKEANVIGTTIQGTNLSNIKAPFAIQRKDIPLQARRQMGEITQPYYPVAKRLAQESIAIENAKLFNAASKDTMLSSPTWRQGLHGTPMPDTKAYGSLKGMYVHPRVYHDVMDLTTMRSGVGQAYDKILGAWKFGKVVLSPSTHSRNIVSNTFLNDLGGMDHIAQAKYAAKAAKHIVTKSETWQEASRNFGGTTYAQRELLELLKGKAKAPKNIMGGMVKTVTTPLKAGAHTAGHIYQQEEVASKFMRYLWNRDKGLSHMAAIKDSNKWLIDYGDLHPLEKTFARRFMPFYTFPRKALPLVLEAAKENPYALAKYPLAAQALQKYSLAKLNLGDKDFDKIVDTLPSYMKTGSYILLPYKDENGDMRFFDQTYMVPWGTLSELKTRGPLDIIMANPFIQTIEDLMHNKSSFTDRTIWEETDENVIITYPGGAKVSLADIKKVSYVWDAMMPGLAPGGSYSNKLIDAFNSKQNKYGKQSLKKEAIAHTVFGLRTQAVDPELQSIFAIKDKQKAIAELVGNIKNMQHEKAIGNVSQADYDRKMIAYKQALTDIAKGTEARH